jgi:two-component system, cell cycle sensor histidine kinase and response regulator CckA
LKVRGASQPKDIREYVVDGNGMHVKNTPVSTQPPLPSYRLLLVEDNSGDRDLTRERLSDVPGFTLAIDDAGTLKAARSLVRDHDYDSLVVDLNLPDSQGLDTLQQLRRSCPDTPIVVLSGDARDHIRSDVLREGAQDFLSKNEASFELIARAILYSAERHRSEAQRTRVEKFFAESPDGVVVTDENGVVLFVNQSALDLLGRTRQDLIGQEFGFSIHDNQTIEVEIFHTADRRTAELRVVPYEWHQRTAFLATMRDVTERTRLADQLRHAQKLEAVGQLAGGVAHDFNNILTVILASVEIVFETLEETHPSRRWIADIQQAGRRAAALTRQLLTFARRHATTPQVLDLNDIVRSIHKMLERLIGEGVRMTLSLQAALPSIFADPDQLGQVLTNLVVNARDAMPQGGTIAIATGTQRLDDSQAVVWGLPPGNYVRLAVKDAGEGMSKDVMDRIFEPFYTTKKERGTGLGLAMVHGIVTQCGGQIRVESERNAGSTFTILLPIAGGARDQIRSGTAVPQTLSGTERILLVEDEAPVRAVALEILSKAGYTVVSVSTIGEAISTWTSATPPYDLVLTDVVMPDASGWVLGEHILAHAPAQKIIFMSGYSHEVLAQGRSAASFKLLQKPFTRLELLRTVRRTLDGRI